MTQSYSMSISDVRQLTNDSVAISFEIPEELVARFQFQHGQFVQLKTNIDGQSVERSYSICTAPYERKLTVGIKSVENGLFSNFANNQLKQGDVLEVSEPQGVFTHTLDSSKKKQYLLVAAGSGITPILSILKMTLASESMSHCTLVYSNKTPESVMFADELQVLTEKYADRFTLISAFSQSNYGDFQGRIDAAVIESFLDLDSVDEFFVCGPQEMSVALHDKMLSQGLSSENAHIELFEIVEGFSEDGGTSQAKIHMIIDGDSFEFDYVDPTRSILDEALDYEPDLPYGCQNGSCGSCQAKVISGSVEMEVNYALSQSEVDEGFVLVCQARPTSSKVDIDYDA